MLIGTSWCPPPVSSNAPPLVVMAAAGLTRPNSFYWNFIEVDLSPSLCPAQTVTHVNDPTREKWRKWILSTIEKGNPPHDCCVLIHARCSLLCSRSHHLKVRSVGAVIRGGAGVRTGAELCRLNRGYLREIPRYILIYPDISWQKWTQQAA